MADFLSTCPCRCFNCTEIDAAPKILSTSDIHHKKKRGEDKMPKKAREFVGARLAGLKSKYLSLHDSIYACFKDYGRKTCWQAGRTERWATKGSRRQSLMNSLERRSLMGGPNHFLAKCSKFEQNAASLELKGVRGD